MSADGMPEVAGVEHRFVDLDARDGPLRIHLAEAGAGEPLLLLHGWPQHWYCWRRVIDPLAGRFRLLMPDLRGFGWSDAPAREYSPRAFAADAIALLDHLGIERVKLVGHDWGGFSVFVLGLEYPERVERIAAFNTPHPWIPQNLRSLAAVWRTWYVVVNALGGGRALRDPARMRRMLGMRGRTHIWSEDEARIYSERLRPEVTSALYRSYLRVAVATLGRSFRDRRLTVPTRLVFGAADSAISTAWLAGGERHGDDFAIELVPGCGHFIPEERPEVVADRILGFMSGSGG
jgi:pimeloyl-ACP methyl ester carboxylesterase